MTSAKNQKSAGDPAGQAPVGEEPVAPAKDPGVSGGAAPKAGEKRTSDPDREEGVNKLIAEVRKTGLCGNCAVFKTCRLEKRGKGVWYCDVYKPASG